jgi:hypothetical protein
VFARLRRASHSARGWGTLLPLLPLPEFPLLGVMIGARFHRNF